MSPLGPELVVATHNPGKLVELRTLLAGLDVKLVGLDEAAPGLTDIPETGSSYLENATLKARAGAVASGRPTLGDDSGLEVDALDGAPGLRSARYSGGGAKANVVKLLEALKDVPEPRRTARFRCVLVVAFPDPATPPIVAEGICEGRIDHAPRGEHGFGYDPVFVPLEQPHEKAGEPARPRTLAEMGEPEKNAISHRGNACRALAARLG